MNFRYPATIRAHSRAPQLGLPWDFPPPPPESVRTDGRYGRSLARSYGDVITKFTRVGRLPNSLLSRLRRVGAPLSTTSLQWLLVFRRLALKAIYSQHVEKALKAQGKGSKTLVIEIRWMCFPGLFSGIIPAAYPGKRRLSVLVYIVSQVILPFYLVFAYDPLVDWSLHDVNITNIFLLFFNGGNVR